MTVLYNPRIITNGLIFCLDAGNIKSYTGSGTTWTDLSSSSSVAFATLKNGPTFSNQNGGTIAFDGVDDYADGTSIGTIANAITLSVWVRHDTVPSATQRYLSVGATEFAVIRHDGVASAGQLHFYILTNNVFRNLRVNSQIAINTWYNMVATWNGTIMRLYKNGSQVGSFTPVSQPLTLSTTSYAISSPTESLDGNIAQVSVYDRALSGDEVITNFNALRGRFGV